MAPPAKRQTHGRSCQFAIHDHFAVPGPIFDTQVRKGSYSNFAPKMADSGMAGRPQVTRQSCHTIAEEPAEPHSTIWRC